MIKLDENYTIKVNGTHGFELHFESEPYKKEVVVKGKKEEKLITTKETYYYPSLSKVLSKYFNLTVACDTKKDLIERVVRVENNIKNFDKVFASKGKVFEL